MANKTVRINQAVAEKLRGENVVLAKFRKRQEKEDKYERWCVVDDAVSAARNAYIGTPENKEPTVSFEKAIGDLIEVLAEIQKGEIKSSKRELGEVPSIA